MQAIELEATLTESHEIHLQLPDTIQASRVKVIVMYDNEIANIAAPKRVFGQFQGQLSIADDFDAELPDSFWLGDDK